MRWRDIPFRPTGRTLRQFAAAWLVFFCGLGAHQYLARGHHQAGVTLGLAGIVIGGLGLVWPQALRWLFVIWMVAAFPVGWLVSQIVLGLMFYGLLTPLALWFRIRRRDVLNRRPAPNRPSFWMPKLTPQDLRRYFRGY